MEALLMWVAQWAVSQALGSGVVKANDLRRLHDIKRQAPSAKVVRYQIALTQEDFDRLPKKEADTVYYVVGEQSTSDAPT